MNFIFKLIYSMSNNNFLNRKKFNLNLMSRSTYKAQDVKKASIHSFMKVPINHVVSEYSYNPNQLGYSVPYMHDKNIPYLIDEKNVIIDSLDRDILLYNNPYDMIINIDPTIKTVKYINIDNIILPYMYELINEQLVTSTYTSLISAIDASRNTIKIDTNITIDGRNIQICNYILEGNNWDINFTQNSDNTTVFRIIKNTSTTVFKYSINSSYITNKVIFLQLDNVPCSCLSTSSQLSNVVQLYPKKIIADSLWFNIKKNTIIFKNNDITNISKLKLRFIDDDGNILSIYNLDNTVITNKYSTTSYSSPKYYIRHPLYSKWQVHIVLKFGTVQPFIKKSLF